MKDEALKLALEALKWASDQIEPENNDHCLCPICKGIDAIQESLAQPEQEPVAYCWKSLRTGDLFDFVENKNGDALNEQGEDFPTLNLVLLYTTPPQRCSNCDSLERQNAELDLRLAEQDQEPFGFLTNKRQRFNFEPNAIGLSNMPMTIDWKIPLYGAPQPQRKPLTDEQIAHATAPVFMGGNPSLTGIARAIEAAHGIKGEA